MQQNVRSNVAKIVVSVEYRRVLVAVIFLICIQRNRVEDFKQCFKKKFNFKEFHWYPIIEQSWVTVDIPDCKCPAPRPNRNK